MGQAPVWLDGLRLAQPAARILEGRRPGPLGGAGCREMEGQQAAEASPPRGHERKGELWTPTQGLQTARQLGALGAAAG